MLHLSSPVCIIPSSLSGSCLYTINFIYVFFTRAIYIATCVNNRRGIYRGDIHQNYRQHRIKSAATFHSRRACAARVRSVCLSVTQHLLQCSFVSQTILLLTGNEGHKFQAVFSENAAFERYLRRETRKSNIARLTPVRLLCVPRRYQKLHAGRVSPSHGIHSHAIK